MLYVWRQSPLPLLSTSGRKGLFLACSLLLAGSTNGGMQDGRENELPQAIKDYRSVKLDKGCLVESIVFADWLMTNDFDRKKSRAVIVEVFPRIGTEAQKHAMVIFTHFGRHYTWDMNYGVHPLKLGGNSTWSMAAQKSFESLVDADFATQKAGHGTFNEQKSILPSPAQSALAVACERLNLTRPVMLLEVEFAHKKHEALATIFEGELYFFHPESGALSGGRVSSATFMAKLKEVANRVFGPSCALVVKEQRLPRT